jgi:tripartite-type tricarboxylate transporter receptor subunit TctC
MLNRRNWLLAATSTLAGSTWAQATAFPSKPIRVVTSSVAGGPADVALRRIVPTVSDLLKQSVIVDNRPGANGLIAAQEVMRAPHDGHTLLNATVSLTVNDAVRPPVGVRLFVDLLPLTDLSQGPLVLLVNPSVPVKTARELVEYGKANPNALSYGSGGPASFLQITGERLKIETGLPMREVPYRSPGADIIDVIAGHIQVGFTVWGACEPHIKSGKLRALAVASDKRIPIAPELPTLAEAGLGSIVATAWTGLFAPAGVPADVMRLLNRTFADAARRPDYVAFYTRDGSEVGGKTPEQFAQFLRLEQQHFRDVIAKANIKLE